MAFVDELVVYIKAGNGGNGAVRWRREKFAPKGGPAGGNGGNGGDVFLRGVKDTSILQKYKFKKEFIAEDGEGGKNNLEHGKNGEDLIIDLPVGSIIRNTSTKEEFFLEEEGQKIQILKGGGGGFGNDHFKSSTNQTPEKATKGKEGQADEFYIEMQLIADNGLIGLPNAGKSSLLNTLTNSQSKVGNFNFTTLSPHLGDFYGTIFADIPGLIEGASDGKGLGHKFLRHIKRTEKLFHCISVESENIKNDYEVIRNELEKYDHGLSEKEEVILITKMDLDVGKEKFEKAKEVFKDKTVLGISIIDDESISEFKKFLSK